MGAMQRRKGGRVEREIVNLHKAVGIHAERVPLSGAAGGGYSGDVDVYVLGRDEAPFVAEVKARATGGGFVTLEKWLSDNDVLFLRRDHAEPLVVLPWRSWLRLIKQGAP